MCAAAGGEGSGPLDDDGAALLQLREARADLDQQSPESVLASAPPAGPSAAALDPVYNSYGFCPPQNDAARKAAANTVGGSIRVKAETFSMFNAYIFSMGEQPVNPATNPALDGGGTRGRWGKPSWKQQQIQGLQRNLLPTLLQTDAGNRTEWFRQAALTSCWNPAPLAGGPMIFRYSEVAFDVSDPNQKRGYYTATAPQVEEFFEKDVPLFLDGEIHRGCRQLLKKVGFAFANNINIKAVEKIQKVSGKKAPGPDKMAGILGPIVFEQIWGAAPPSSVTKYLEDYGETGVLTIFGLYIYPMLKPLGIPKKVSQDIDKVTDWAMTTPFASTLIQARDAGLGKPWAPPNKTLVKAITTATMFAGIIGTSDMVTKCVDYQKKMPAHVTMFKADPEKYLIELMRFDSAVTSFTKVLPQNETMNLEGRSINLAAGVPVQSTLATSNRDPMHWTTPDQFDPNREQLEDVLSWNGKAKPVEAMDLEKAPRYCPGYCLSLKVGAAACARMLGSYDELKAAGKLLANDGKVECSNFGTLAEPVVWQP